MNNNLTNALNTRKLIFIQNLDRALRLAEHSLDTSLDNDLTDDIGMFSVVAAVGSLDEFVKSATFDILFLYLTQQWTPPSEINLNRISKNNPTILINATLSIISRFREGEQAYDPNFINDLRISIHNATEKINYQDYQSIKTIMEDLSGKKFSHLPNSQISLYSSTINDLAQKRHKYVHRLAVDPLSIAARTYEGPVTSKEIRNLKTFADELIELFS